MRKYDLDDERAIRTERVVREWFRSGLIEQAQNDRILPELKVDLRRTNLFLRLILFAFGILIIASAVLLATYDHHSDWTTGAVCLLGATACVFLAEFLVGNFRLYRFGVEEAAAVSAAILAGIGSLILALSLHVARPAEFGAFIGLVIGSIVAFAVYLRFGYVYAAMASMLCLSAASFQTGLPEVTQRFLSAGFLACVFVAARVKRRKYGYDSPSDEYSAIQCAALAGIYAFLNLHLQTVHSSFRVPEFPPPFYWFTYLIIWLLPAIGLYCGLRDRDRSVLDVSGLIALVTLLTNKAYLGVQRQTWDPILLGVLLIGIAVVLRQWLSKGDRNGFTPSRILSSDRRRITMVGTASAALHTGLHAPESAPGRTPEPGGGKSGGAGASGSF